MMITMMLVHGADIGFLQAMLELEASAEQAGGD